MKNLVQIAVVLTYDADKVSYDEATSDATRVSEMVVDKADIFDFETVDVTSDDGRIVSTQPWVDTLYADQPQVWIDQINRGIKEGGQ